MVPPTSLSAPPSSWLNVAPTSDFSLANLPFGICSFPALHQPRPRCCTILGNHVIDLSLLAEAGLFDGIDGLNSASSVFAQSTLNAFMALSRSIWTAVRVRLFSLLVSAVDGGDTNCNSALSSNAALRAAAIHPVSEVKMHLPAEIGDYTDFYSSREHATNGTQVQIYVTCTGTFRGMISLTYCVGQVCFCFYGLSNATHLCILFYIQKHTLAITKLVPCSGGRTTLSSPTGFTYQSAITADRPQFVSVVRPSRGHADSCRRTETIRSRAAHMVPAV